VGNLLSSQICRSRPKLTPSQLHQVQCNVAAGPRPPMTTFKNSGNNKSLSVDLRDEGTGELPAFTFLEACRSKLKSSLRR
jgi:hypothetical protein